MEQFAQYTLNGLLLGGTYAALAVGFALTFSALRVINLTHADIFMVAMFVALLVAENVTHNLLVIVVFAVGGAALLGLVVERTVIRPLQGTNILTPMLATIGASIMIEYGMQGLFGPDPIAFPSLLPGNSGRLAGIQANLPQMVDFAIAIVVLAATSFYVRRTRWGLAARAVAERRDMAAAFGVNVTRVAQITIALAAAMAGGAGIGIVLLYGSVWPFVGQLYMLKAFICVLIAGNRSVEAVMALALILGLLETYTTGYLSSTYRDVLGFALLIVILYFRPNGLFGSYAAERA